MAGKSQRELAREVEERSYLRSAEISRRREAFRGLFGARLSMPAEWLKRNFLKCFHQHYFIIFILQFNNITL